jgi:hypothetical protein
MKTRSIGAPPLLSSVIVVGAAAFGAVIPERNPADALASGLLGPPVSLANGVRAVAATNVYLTGISDLGTKKAYFQVVVGPETTGRDRSLYPVVAEGEEDRGIKVVQVNLAALTARVRINEGAPIELRLGTNGIPPGLSEPPGSRAFLTGLSDIGGRKVAYFQIVPGPQGSELDRYRYPILEEGQKEAGIEVLQIDAEARTVRVRINGSAPVQLTWPPGK